MWNSGNCWSSASQAKRSMGCYTSDAKDIRETIVCRADVVKFLSNPLQFSGFKITTNNWFKSFQLFAGLLQKQFALFCTMRKNGRELSFEFATRKTRRVGSKLFGLSDIWQIQVSIVCVKEKQRCRFTVNYA